MLIFVLPTKMRLVVYIVLLIFVLPTKKRLVVYIVLPIKSHLFTKPTIYLYLKIWVNLKLTDLCLNFKSHFFLEFNWSIFPLHHSNP